MRRLELSSGEEIWHQERIETAADKKWVTGELVVTNLRIVLRVANPKRGRGWLALGWGGLLFRALDQATSVPERLVGEIERSAFESATVETRSVHIRSRGTGYAATWFTVETPSATDLATFLRRWSAGEDPRGPTVTVPAARIVKR